MEADPHITQSARIAKIVLPQGYTFFILMESIIELVPIYVPFYFVFYSFHQVLFNCLALNLIKGFICYRCNQNFIKKLLQIWDLVIKFFIQHFSSRDKQHCFFSWLHLQIHFEVLLRILKFTKNGLFASSFYHLFINNIYKDMDKQYDHIGLWAYKIY